MNKFKNILLLMVAFVATSVFAACSDDDDDNVVQTVLSLNPESLSFTSDGGSQTISISGNAPIKNITTTASWLTGEAGDFYPSKLQTSLTVTAEENKTSQARTDTVKIEAGMLTIAIPVSQAAGNGSADPHPGTITAKAADIAKAMYPGWNLGNTMEAGTSANNWTNNAGLAAETSWQSTTTTKAIIDAVRDAGFKSVRIPTAWVMGHITDVNNVTIDDEWMSRVKEIINYCIDDGLYVIINDHYDGGWLEHDGFTDAANVDVKKEQLRKLWTNIATALNEYGDHVIFAGLNEPGVGGASPDASGNLLGNADLTSRLLEYEQVFIDAVRATGGNNSTRTLVVQAPYTEIEDAVSSEYNFDLSKLTDPAGTGYLMVEVHFYAPPAFTGVWENNAPIYFWGAANHVEGSSNNATWGEEDYVATQMGKMKSNFFDKGYPVIIGEYGANWRQLSANQDEHDASIKLWYQTVVQQAINNGCVPMAWDTNYAQRNGTTGTMTILNRASQSIFNQPALDGITAGVAAATWPQ